ncbi:condensation domain-containing protein, partial [Phytohabitans kaempferiae]
MLGRDLGFWRERLAGLSVLELPTDRPRPVVRSSAGALVRGVVPAVVVDGLRGLCRGGGATLFVGLVAAVQVVLSRWSGSLDVGVATVSAGRDRAELENVVGFFVNTLVLRSRIDPGVSFRDLLGGVRETVLEAFAHQRVPFERVVDEVVPVRDPARLPLAPVMVVLQGAGVGVPELVGLEVEEYALPCVAAQFEVTFEFTERSDGSLGLIAEYNTDLFDEATVQRMVGHVGALLSGVVADPDGALASVSMLTTAEHAQLDAYNNTTAAYFADRPVHEMFTVQANTTPQAVAVIDGDVQLTFAQLETRANQLAHHLIQQGATVGVPVAVCLPRGWQMVTAMLAVLKTGGVYVPLDPAYPADRVAFMLADTNAPLLVTTTSHAIPEHTGTTIH